MISKRSCKKEISLKMKRYIFFLIILITLSALCAAEKVQLELKDITTGEIITNIIAITDASNFKDDQFILRDEALMLSMEPGVYDLTFKLDDPSTPAKDYYGKKSISVQGQYLGDVYVRPVGSVRGIVKDSLDNRVPNARLKFECSNNVQSELPRTADETGFYSADFIGAGSCIITASYEKAVGSTNVQVEKGQILENIEIMLDNTIIDVPSYTILYMSIIVIIIITFVLLLKIRKTAPNPEQPKPEHTPKRAQDIMKTLHPKEQEITNFLLNNNNKSIQASIRHNTGIPRTSLARVLESLENKNIVKIRKEGKAIRVSLTNWFLGRE